MSLSVFHFKSLVAEVLCANFFSFCSCFDRLDAVVDVEPQLFI